MEQRMTGFSNNSKSNLLIAFILFILIIGGLVFVNYQYSKNNPGGNDFLVHYIGARSLIYDNLSPYSDAVAEKIQIAAYGHPAQGIEHELRVAYPLYSVFLFAPFSLVNDYVIARALWMTILEIALIVITFQSFQIFDWKPDLKIQAGILLFSLIWYHAVRGIINGNAIILITLLITSAFNAIKKYRDSLAGFLLAISTIKPHLVILLLPFVVIWAIYQRRWKLILWFSGSFACLIFLGWIIIPDWIVQNLWEVIKYPEYNPAGTLASAIAEWLPVIENQLKWGIAAILGLILVFEGWRARTKDLKHFLWTSSLVILISQWIGIQTDPGNFVLLFPVIILIVSVLDKKWKERGNQITSFVLLLFFVLPWLLFILTIQKSYQPIQSPLMFIPVPLLCFLGLYWVKWWMISPSSNITTEMI